MQELSTNGAFLNNRLVSYDVVKFLYITDVE